MLQRLSDLRGRGTFSALKFPNFRRLWTGSLISNSGDWMDQIALNWLVVQTTDSPIYLGLVNLGRGLPILFFALFAGIAADRAERRPLMIATQGVGMLLAVILTALVATDSASIWLVLAIATARGIVIAFNLPTRQALISELVPKEHLGNAVALYAMTLNLTKVIGPLIAGIVISLFGLTACFALNALSYVAVLGMLWSMAVPPSVRERPTGTIAKNLIEGFTFVWRNKSVRMLVLVAAVPNFFGLPYITLLAIFADSVFDIGASGLGWLTASAALGSVTGALVLASFARASATGKAMLVFMMLFGTLLVSFALNPLVWLAPLLLLGIGAMQTAYNASNSTILQMIVPDHLRGRVLSTLYINKGLVQVGTAFTAALAALIGIRYAMAATATVMVVCGIVLFRSPVAQRLGG